MKELKQVYGYLKWKFAELKANGEAESVFSYPASDLEMVCTALFKNKPATPGDNSMQNSTLEFNGIAVDKKERTPDFENTLYVAGIVTLPIEEKTDALLLFPRVFMKGYGNYDEPIPLQMHKLVFGYTDYKGYIFSAVKPNGWNVRFLPNNLTPVNHDYSYSDIGEAGKLLSKLVRVSYNAQIEINKTLSFLQKALDEC